MAVFVDSARSQYVAIAFPMLPPADSTTPLPALARLGDTTARPVLIGDLVKDETESEARARRAAEAKAARAKLAAERRRLLAKGWGARFVDAILNRQITLGMTAAMLRESWGEPQRVNTTQTQYGRSEQWVYGDDFVYLENGRVTSWQTSR